MTVNELINLLQDFDGDTEVVIAEYQGHGSNFAYDVGEVSKDRYDNWDEDSLVEDGTCVQIVLGYQIGTMIGGDDEVVPD